MICTVTLVVFENIKLNDIFFGCRLLSNRQCDIGRIQLALNLWNVRKSIPITSCSQKRLAAAAALWENGAMGHKYEVLKLLCIN